MATTIFEYNTKLPDEIVDRIIKDTDNLSLQSAKVHRPDTLKDGNMPSRRNSYCAYFNTDDSWIGAFIWYYVMKANRQNFLYDITCYDGENIQYTVYEEGQFYGWHPDQHLYTEFTPKSKPSSKYSELDKHVQQQCEYTRKLSFSLQLSHPDEYEGGELQFLDAGLLREAPKERGQLIIFDSRVLHRVRKVKSGTRKSIVGWVVGPRWK